MSVKKSVPQVLLDLFRDNFGEQGPFKGFREGDPIIPAQSILPALFISEKQTNYELGPTGFDQVEHQIIIQVVYNKKDDYGKPDEASSLDRTLDEITQARDATTNEFLPNTIMGVLRKNYTMGNLTIQSIGSVKKGVVPRSEELLTAEAHIELTVDELVPVSGRS